MSHCHNINCLLHILKHSAVPHRNVVCLSQLQILIKIGKLDITYTIILGHKSSYNLVQRKAMDMVNYLITEEEKDQRGPGKVQMLR